MVQIRCALRGLAVVSLLATLPAQCGSYEPRSSGANTETPAVARNSLVTGSNAITQAADEFRTGWYPDQPGLDPAIVASGGFGRTFQTALPLTAKEQVYTQPLVSSDGSHVLVGTQGNNLYVLDAKTGAITASRALGKPWNQSDVACGDILPTIGVTGTPVIDVASNTAYLFSKSYDATGAAIWYFHAVDATTLDERPGFPVTVSGAADNDPTLTFNAKYQHQRTGLLLLNGVVYGGFSAHCDVGPYHGWVMGISTSGQIVARFATEADPASNGGAGIWQSGTGLISDGPGRILFVTGNGRSQAPKTPVPEDMPTLGLGESVVRLDVQAGGGVKAAQWFAPYDEGMLGDSDFGAGGPAALPSPMFGTASTPNLLIICGKKGVLYTLDRDHLGGFINGAGNTDLVVGTLKVGGGMWSRPGVWPGDGGWVYVVTSGGVGIQALQYGVNGQGVPTFAAVGKTTDTFGGFSGSPIVTSNGTNAGSALMWITSETGQLRAYNAVPDANGVLNMVFSDNYGPHVKFQSPGVGNGTLFVGTSDGHVAGYAARPAVVSGPAVDFGTVVVGSTKTATVTLTAMQATTVTALTSSDAAAFTVGAATPPLPAKLAANQSMTVQVTFAPTQPAGYSAALNVTSSAGAGGAPVRGTGQANGPYLTASPTSLSFGTVPTGSTNSASVVFTNQGSKPLTFASLTPPMTPYSAMGLPAAGMTLAPGATVTTTVLFTPMENGPYSASLGVQSDGGNVTVAVTGAAAPMPVMVISPLNLDFGNVPPGTSKTMTFTISNTGGSTLTIAKSKPPSQGIFTATTSLPEGSVIAPGASVTETIVASPMGSGDFSDSWIITGNDRSGLQQVNFTVGDTAGGIAANVDGGGPASSAANGDSPAGWPSSSRLECAVSAPGVRSSAAPWALGIGLAALSWARRSRRRPRGDYRQRGLAIMFGLLGVAAASTAYAAIPAGYKGMPFDPAVAGGAMTPAGTAAGPYSIPGRLEFENYDMGGLNVGYFTADHIKCGAPAYRSDGQTASLCLTSTQPDTVYGAPNGDVYYDTGDSTLDGTTYPSATTADVYIGAVRPGDWFNITVDVKTAGTYQLGSTWASGNGPPGKEGGNGAMNLQVSVNGTKVLDWTDVFPNYNTQANFHNWKPYPNMGTVTLDAGLQVIKLSSGSDPHLNLDYVQFSLVLPDGGIDTGDGSAGTPDSGASTSSSGSSSSGSASSSGSGGSSGSVCSSSGVASGSTGSSGTIATSGSGGSSGSAGASGESSGGSPVGAASSGCSCRVGPDSNEAPFAFALGLATAGAFLARASRRRQTLLIP